MIAADFNTKFMLATENEFIYPSAFVSGLAWKPNGLSFLHAFLSSISRFFATLDILSRSPPSYQTGAALLPIQHLAGLRFEHETCMRAGGLGKEPWTRWRTFNASLEETSPPDPLLLPLTVSLDRCARISMEVSE